VDILLTAEPKNFLRTSRGSSFLGFGAPLPSRAASAELLGSGVVGALLLGKLFALLLVGSEECGHERGS
jgi:hypothetical protein